MRPAPGSRGGLLALGFLAVIAIIAMLLTSGQMSDLRMAVPPLTRAMNWLEGLPVPFDMDHVAFFALLALLARIVARNVRWYWLLAGFALLASGTELLQFLTVGRTPKLLDARDDMIGTCIGLALGSLPLWYAGLAQWLLRLSAALLYAGVAMLPFQQWPLASAFGFPLLPSDLAILAALVVRMFALATFCAPLQLGGFHGWLAAYVLAMLLAVLALPPFLGTSAEGAASCAISSPLFGNGLAKWIGIVWLALIAALACDAATNVVRCRRLFAAWLLGAVAAAIAAGIAIIGFYAGETARAWVAPLLSHYGSLPPGAYPRVQGLFANANMAGVFFLLSAGIAMMACDEGVLSKPRLRGFLLLVAPALLATGSPAIGGTALLLGWWWFRAATAPSPLRTVALAVGALVALVNLALLFVNPAAPFAQPSVRMQMWHQAWLTWQADAWRGVGLGQPAAGLAYQAPDGGWQYLTDAHNIMLNLGAQGGLPAVAAFLGLVGWLLLKAHAKLLLRGPWGALLLAVAYLGIGGSFEDARVLWVFMGAIAGMLIACGADARAGTSSA